MTRHAGTKQSDPAEGSRDNVNVNMPAEGRPRKRGRQEGPAQRSAPGRATRNRDEEAHVPPREESREPSGSHHRRRESM